MFKLLLVAFLLATPAYGYDNHEGYSNSRGGYDLPYLFITQSEGIHSTATFATPNPESDEDTISKTNYKGVALKTAIGTELVRFVRFSAYHLHKDLQNSPSNSLRGTELGGEVKLNFSGPVVNIQFGLGLFGSRNTFQTNDGGVVYYGNGFQGTLGFERFLSNQASFLFTLKAQSEDLTGEERSNQTKIQVQTAGAAAALVLWLN